MDSLRSSTSVERNITTAHKNIIQALHKFIFENEGDRKNRKRLRDFSGFEYDETSDEYNKKLDYVDKNLSKADLVSICNVLKLNYDNENLKLLIFQNLKKGSLLKDHAHEEQVDENDSESDEDNDAENDDEKAEDDDSNSKCSEKSYDARSTISVVSQVLPPRFALSFQDIEESIRSFDGSDTYPVETWITEFEEMSKIMLWDDLQKFVFAKKSLKGLAKLYIQSEKHIYSWKDLKSSLLKEFKTCTNSAKLHKMLSERKMKRDESVMEYFLKMREMANRGAVEDSAIMQYVIDGIQDLDINKTILYGARSLHDFKDKLKLYESIQKKNKKAEIRKLEFKNNERDKDNKGEKYTKKDNYRCYNCGERGHSSKSCSHKEKGMKCFKCNQFGHKASECKNNENLKSNMLCLNSKRTDISNKVVKIKNKILTALIDTGSKFNVIKEDVYKTLQDVILREADIFLVGFGQNKKQNGIKTIGCFEDNIEIDGLQFILKFYVVPSECMDHQLIIGNELFEKAEITITAAGIVIKKIETKEDKEPFSILNISELINDVDIDIDENVTEKAKEKAKELIKNYRPEKTRTTNVEMKIILNDETPIYHQPRRLPLKEKQFVEKQIEEWIENDIIEPCYSDYSSQVVVAKKRDGTSRLCIDFRKINKVIVKDRYPLPLIEDQLDRLEEARIFSTIDLKNGFFHVEVHKDSRKYTSFVTHNGQYQFKKVPFGLCNSPAVFQRHINCIFRELSIEGVALPYIDDVIIPAKDEIEAIERLEKVLMISKEFGLEINLKKCQLLKRKVEFLGYEIENGQLYPSPLKTEAVRRFPQPQNIKQIQSFLGLTGYFRKFIPKYAQIAKPLSDLLKKDNQFKFTHIEENSFETLKKALSEKPVLGIYNQNYDTELHTDASIDGYGAVLLQKSPLDSQLHPIYYMSRKTTDQERKYTSYELEVLAIIEALKKFRVYLLGRKFKLVTDCSAFEKTLKKKELVTRVARWILLLEEFDFEVEHRTGTRIRHVDSLSRNPIYMIEEDNLISRIRKAQEDDEDLKSIKEVLKIKPYDDYIIKKDILYKFESGQELLVIPRVMQMEIIKRAHERGHFSIKKTRELISKNYFIPKLEQKITKCIANCITCILTNRKLGKQEGELHPLFKEDSPLYTYHIDFLGPLESTNKNYNHIFAVIDSFTKFVWLYPTKSTSSKDVIEKLEIQKRTFGNPAQLISDRGSAFVSNEFRNYCKEEGIKHFKITTGLPRANGQVERLNSVIINVLSKLTINDPTKWFKYVDKVQQIINSTYHRSIQATPFEILVGVKMRTKDDMDLKDLIEAEIKETFKDARENLRKDAKEQILKVQSENKRTYNLRRKKATKYRKDDLVAIKRTQLGGGLKLKPKFLGPYRVVKVKNNDTYDLIKEGNGDGPARTSSCAEYMKLFPFDGEDELETFGTNVYEDGRDVEPTE